MATPFFLVAAVIAIFAFILVIVAVSEDSYAPGTSAPLTISTTFDTSYEDEEPEPTIGKHPKRKPMRRTIAAKPPLPKTVMCPNCGDAADTQTGICPSCHGAVFTLQQVKNLM